MAEISGFRGSSSAGGSPRSVSSRRSRGRTRGNGLGPSMLFKMPSTFMVQYGSPIAGRCIGSFPKRISALCSNDRCSRDREFTLRQAATRRSRQSAESWRGRFLPMECGWINGDLSTKEHIGCPTNERTEPKHWAEADGRRY